MNLFNKFFFSLSLIVIFLFNIRVSHSAVFTVTNTNDTGAGSLRQAIMDANVDSVLDLIHFNISGAGPHTISPTSPLPPTEGPTVIDGTTQPGFSGTPIIELNGSGVVVFSAGLLIGGGNSTVRGLVINRFNNRGIALLLAGNNTVQGNYIGTDVTGTIDLGNGASGVDIFAGSANNIIGGTAAGERNLISGNGRHGVEITTSGNLVQGNYIGTKASGTEPLGNSGDGANISNSPNTNNTIGGTSAAARNIISGNGGGGVAISNDATGTLVQGNFIGTDVTGTLDLGNTEYGVLISVANNNTIGGTVAGAGNLISGNGIAIGRHGIAITNSSGNLVQGNFIGTDVSGTAALGNFGAGVFIVGANNSIGGTATGMGNTIAFNGDDGVLFQFGLGTGNAIVSNSIFSNAGLGIDLEPNGATPNDSGDGDSGPNNLQNYPVLDSASDDGQSLKVWGRLNSTPNSSFDIEFFSNDSCDTSGYGEGKYFLVDEIILTDSSGKATFNFTFFYDIPGSVSSYLTSTATDSSGNTSEFSQCRLIPSLCIAKPGDATGDGNILLSDIVRIINFLFRGAAAPDPLCRGDANGSGTILLSDIVYLVNFIFKSGPAPVKTGVCCL